MTVRRIAARAVAGLLALPVAIASANAPLADSRCRTPAIVDAAFRDAALNTLEGLVVRAPGKPADGAIRIDHGTGLRDAKGQTWFRIAAYQVNLGVVGALAAGPRALPTAEGWLRWQARHIAVNGPARGVVLDTWIRPGDQTESTCPDPRASATCDDVDAYDSTAASTLLVADAWLRAGGDANLLREPAMRAALEAAAEAMVALAGTDGLTIAKPSHRVVYTMDQVEVAAGWRAWARVQRDAYAQPASAANSLANAERIERALRTRLAHGDAWRVSLDDRSPQPANWYPDTVAQAWPLLWLPDAPGEPDDARRRWTRAIASWQSDHQRSWRAVNVDPDGFWWPAVAVAALCTGDRDSAARWVARAREQLLDRQPRFARPFHVGDLLWLLWMAEPQARG